MNRSYPTQNGKRSNRIARQTLVRVCLDFGTNFCCCCCSRLDPLLDFKLPFILIIFLGSQLSKQLQKEEEQNGASKHVCPYLHARSICKGFQRQQQHLLHGQQAGLGEKGFTFMFPTPNVCFFSYYTTWVSRVACANFLDTFRLRRTNNYHGVVSLVYGIINFYRI